MMVSDSTFAPVCMCSHEKQHGCAWIRDLTAEQLLLGFLQGGYPPSGQWINGVWIGLGTDTPTVQLNV